MMRSVLIIIFVLGSLSVRAQDALSDRNVIKFNLTTPFSFTPTFEFSYERFLADKISIQFNGGFIAGTASGLNLEPIYFQPSPSPLGYRVAVSPRFYVLPNKAGTGGGYFAPVLMFKQLRDKYEAEFAMSDIVENTWWGVTYYQQGTVKMTKNVADFSLQMGYESGKRFVVDFYGGLGVRYRQIQEVNDVVLAFEGQQYYKTSPNYSGQFDTTPYDGSLNVKNITYSFPLGVRFGYRF